MSSSMIKAASERVVVVVVVVDVDYNTWINHANSIQPTLSRDSNVQGSSDDWEVKMLVEQFDEKMKRRSLDGMWEHIRFYPELILVLLIGGRKSI